MSIAEAAESTGLTVHTLRYYERDGLLLDPVERAASGHRRYTEHDLVWIRLLTKLRSTGMPIREVRSYAELVRAGAGNEQARMDLLRRHRDAVLDQLALVRDHLRAIDHKIEVYEQRAGGSGTSRET